MPSQKRATTPKKATKLDFLKGINPTPFYILLVVLFVLYISLQRSPAAATTLGAAIVFVIIFVLFIELVNGVSEEGYAKNLLEIAGAILVVLLIWFGLRFFLNTPSPLDVVPSCSMLPVLNRGDLILIQGANQNTIKAPIVNVNSTTWNKSFTSAYPEGLQCVAYAKGSGTTYVSQIVKPGYSIGLLASTSPGVGSIVSPSYENGLAVKYTCGIANIKFQNGTTEQEATTTAITVGNTTITGDKNNSIVVYQTIPQDLFYQYGDGYIVHRAYAIVNVSGTYYVLTKGDNNPGLDIQYNNYAPNMSLVEGKVIGGLPYLGYIKLILSSSFTEPTGCNFTTQN